MKNFHQLTLNPDNAKRLKALILDLAVRGKLTQQWRQENPNVPNAQTLLADIKAEKQRLIAENKIRKEKKLPPIKAEEIPFDVPDSWVWCRLGTVTHNLGQKKPDKKFHYIDVASIDNYKGVIKEDLNLVLSKDAPSRARKRVIKGTVIYSTVRPYLKNIAIITENYEPEAIASTAFAVLYPTSNYSSQYLYYYLRSSIFTKYVKAKMKGVSYPAINDKNFFNGLIPLPPLPEQKAIVKIVSDLFESIDMLVAKAEQRIAAKSDYVAAILRQLEIGDTAATWQQLVPQFPTFFDTVESVKALRQTILQLAVQGKLTTKWRQENPDTPSATDLLEQIKAEKKRLIAEKKIRKEKALPPIKKEEIPFDVPEGWVWCRLGDICNKITDGTHNSPPNTQMGNYKYITAKNIKDYGIDLTKISYVSEEIHSKIYQRCNVQFGDILYIKDGATTGVCCLNNLEEEFSLLSSVALIKPSHHIYNSFVLSAFRSPFYYDLMRRGMSGVAITRVTLKKLKKSFIPLPPLSEQQAIVTQVETLLGYCDALEAAIVERGERELALIRGRVREVLEG